MRRLLAVAGAPANRTAAPAPDASHERAPGEVDLAATWSAGELGVVAAATLVAFLVRLPHLGSASLWLDEAWSIATSRMPWRSVAHVVLHQDSNASLYYALLHLWMLLGEDEATVRLLSVLLAAASVPLVYGLGRRLAGPRTGALAALLLALNGFHVQFSQEARGYSLVVLLVTAATWLFVKAVEEGGWRAWAGWVATGALAVYAHVFAVLVLAAHGASLLWLRRRDVPWRRAAASAAAIAALVLPIAVLLFARMHEPSPPLSWAPRPSPRLALRFLWLLAGNTNAAGDPTPRDALPGVPLLLACLALSCVALAAATRTWRRARRSIETWRRWLPFAWLVVPPASAFAVSFVKPMFVSKYLIVCLPALALSTAIGIASFRRAWARLAAVIAVTALAAGALPGYYAFRAGNRAWQDATARVLSRARPGDAVIFVAAAGRLLFDYYGARFSESAAPLEIVYPRFPHGTDDPEVLRYLPPLLDDLVDDTARRHARVWLVRTHDEAGSALVAGELLRPALAARFAEVDARRFDGYQERVIVELYAGKVRGWDQRGRLVPRPKGRE